MNIKINLEDERLCKGCPLGNGRMECQGGFKRELGKLFEYDRRTGLFDYALGKEINNKDTAFDFIRPQACVLATEQVAKAIETIKEKKSG